MKSNSKEKQIDNMASVLQSQVNQILSQQALSRHWLAKSRNMFDRITVAQFHGHHKIKNKFWYEFIRKSHVIELLNHYV